MALSGSTSRIVALCITTPSLRDISGLADCKLSHLRDMSPDSLSICDLRARNFSVTLMKLPICLIRPPTKSLIWRRVNMPRYALRAFAFMLRNSRIFPDVHVSAIIQRRIVEGWFGIPGGTVVRRRAIALGPVVTFTPSKDIVPAIIASAANMTSTMTLLGSPGFTLNISRTEFVKRFHKENGAALYRIERSNACSSGFVSASDTNSCRSCRPYTVSTVMPFCSSKPLEYWNNSLSRS